MAYFDDRHHADLFKRDLTHPNWMKIAVIVGIAAFWIAAIEIGCALF